MRSGIFCSLPPGLWRRESQPWANMSSGDSAASGTAEVDAFGPALAAALLSFLALSAACWARSLCSSRLPNRSA